MGTALKRTKQLKSSQSKNKNVDFNRSIADGVSEIHRFNYVHRDLKPDNIVSHYPEENNELDDFHTYKISNIFSDLFPS